MPSARRKAGHHQRKDWKMNIVIGHGRICALKSKDESGATKTYHVAEYQSACKERKL